MGHKEQAKWWMEGCNTLCCASHRNTAEISVETGSLYDQKGNGRDFPKAASTEPTWRYQADGCGEFGV